MSTELETKIRNIELCLAHVFRSQRIYAPTSPTTREAMDSVMAAAEVALVDENNTHYAPRPAPPRFRTGQAPPPARSSSPPPPSDLLTRSNRIMEIAAELRSDDLDDENRRSLQDEAQQLQQEIAGIGDQDDEAQA